MIYENCLLDKAFFIYTGCVFFDDVVLVISNKYFLRQDNIHLLDIN